MSLNWNISKCKNYKKLINDKNYPMTESVIFMTMAVDLGGITEENVEEFIWRAAVVQELGGSYLFAGGGGRVYIGSEDIRRRIGLSVNVADMSRDKWLAKLTRIDSDLPYDTEIEDAAERILDRVIARTVERQALETQDALKVAKKRAKAKKKEANT